MPPDCASAPGREKIHTHRGGARVGAGASPSAQTPGNFRPNQLVGSTGAQADSYPYSSFSIDLNFSRNSGVCSWPCASAA